MKKILLYILLFCFSTSSAQVFPGDIIITEFMADPSVVTDANGEWIEIFNTTNNTIDISGFYLSDGGADTTQLISATPLLIAPASYFVLGVNGDISINGGVSVNYVLSGYTVNNSSSSIILTDSLFNIIDETNYSLTSFGVSTNLDPFFFDAISNDDPDSWCDGTLPYGSGDLGTPGGNNVSCTTIGIESAVAETFSIVKQNETVILVANQPAQLYIYETSGRKIAHYEFQAGNHQVDLSSLNKGCYLFYVQAAEKHITRKFIR
jgi:hypothetical protein